MGGTGKNWWFLWRGLAALGICLSVLANGDAVRGMVEGNPTGNRFDSPAHQKDLNPPIEDGHPPEYIDPQSPTTSAGALYLPEPDLVENPVGDLGDPALDGRVPSGGSLRSGSFPALLSAGGYHTCAVGTDGRIQCWGWNNFNQADPPQELFILTTGGYAHTCGLRPDGVIDCWGLNSNGQAAPPAPASGEHFIQVSAGYAFNCALRDDGRAVCWGEDDSHQVRDTPTTITFLSVEAGAFHACGVRSSGGVRCWGLNTSGQALSPSGTFLQVAPGYRHTCGLRNDGSLLCWGDNSYGQRDAPAGVFVQISSGDFHSCALRSDGSITCWGRNNFNQISLPENGAGHFVRLEAGSWHNCAQRWDGALVCWGRDDVGQSTPAAGTFGPRRLEAGSLHTCGIASNGEPTCWGENSHGESSPPGESFVQISAGGDHSCGLHADGTLACWGSDLQGQSPPPAHNPGDFNSASLGWQFSIGALASGGLTGWGLDGSGQASPPPATAVQYSAGKSHACAVEIGGSLICWGDSSFGKTIPPAGSFVQVSAGGEHACAISILGDVSCWGDSTSGQTDAPAGRFIQISAGDSHTCGILSNGALACWGDNTYGQSTPPAGRFVQVSAGMFHTCGIRADNTRTCWGDNQQGQAPHLEMQPPSLPVASVNQPYDQVLGASGGTPPYTFTLRGGSFPPGILLDPAGRLNGIPLAAGNYTFTLQATDSHWLMPLSKQVEYVLRVNSGPIAQRDAYAISEDTVLVVDPPGVLHNDWDPEGDPLSALLDTPPMRGDLAFNPDGSFIYTPTLNDYGSLIFTYLATDGIAASQAQTVTISIDPLNDPPYTLPDVYTGTRNSILSIPAPGVLSNDGDVEGDPLTVTLEIPPGRGTLNLAEDGSFIYLPDPDDYGSFTFSYLAWDGSAFSEPGWVTLNIREANFPPRALADVFTTSEDVPLVVAAPGVLGNDSDPDGDPLSAGVDRLPLTGVLEMAGDGSFNYFPPANFHGVVTFTYRASDPWLSSDPITVTIGVTPVNDVPVVEAGPDLSGSEGDVFAFQGSYFDPDGWSEGDMYLWDFNDGTQISGTLQPEHIFLEDGVYTVTLTVTDALGGAGSDWLRVQVANALPVVEVGTDLLGRRGSAVQFQGTAWDPGSLDKLSYRWEFGDGAVETGTLAPVHTYLQAGIYTVILYVMDDDGGQASDSLQVSVSQSDWQVWMPVMLRH